MLFPCKLPTINVLEVISRPITYSWKNKITSGGLVWKNEPTKVFLRGHRDLSMHEFDKYIQWVHYFYSPKVSSFKMDDYPQSWVIPNKVTFIIMLW